MSNVEQGVQQELAKLLDDFIAGLQQLRQRLAPSPPSPSAAEQKRYRILPEQAAISPQIVPAPSILTRSSSTCSLQSIFQPGWLRGLSQTTTSSSLQQLNNIGATTDLGRTVDFVMVSPTIDAQIEFDRDIKATTPVISGGTIFRWNLRVRTIHHKAVSTTLTGQL